ncbi:ABC transporter ATP-binding protein [Marinagarivorans cellulosilyticus]|uniref:ABC-2 type transport system ATP-binding protein n=1 Tax=Marinagarivorans cellulosilyticus TaxID=2721545 RepID=A0AAN1WIM4_9GAMM|nr:ABC transporter ATP-binding protein [Marinagarivorans cellulosilyticus]BCD98264.1 ABC-2 type transport system ATP-binding protein [Marinagarivorans cellulosilyticus]
MTAALAITGLQKTYSNSFTALKGIDLTVQPGDFFALLGPNGAGKSTTIGIISSLVKKTAGQVSIFGCDIDTQFSAAKQHLGLVPQEFNFHMFEKVSDIVINQAGYYGIPKTQATRRTQELLQQLELWDKRDTPARMLSGGMKRRLMIARALVHEPKLLVLDEPTAGVDIELRRSMWEFLQHINQAGTTIILTTHYLEEAEQLCRNIAIINNGNIIENTNTKELLKRLDKEVFIFDSNALPAVIPALNGYDITRVDAHTLEVVIQKGQALNTVFDHLSAHQITISSMRNKANRLEELFVNLVNKGVK